MELYEAMHGPMHGLQLRPCSHRLTQTSPGPLWQPSPAPKRWDLHTRGEGGVGGEGRAQETTRQARGLHVATRPCTATLDGTLTSVYLHSHSHSLEAHSLEDELVLCIDAGGLQRGA
jgi:hypothetical protein